MAIKMKKIIFSLVLLIIVSIFSFAVYNSKSEFYRKHNEFYNQIFTAQVTKIVEGTGTWYIFKVTCNCT